MVVRQKLGYIIWITYYMKVFYLFYEKIMKYVCSFTHSSNLCPVPIGNFSILPKWHFWTHAWNSKLFLPKDFFWGIMKVPFTKTFITFSRVRQIQDFGQSKYKLGLFSKRTHGISKILFNLGSCEFLARLESKIRKCLFFDSSLL